LTAVSKSRAFNVKIEKIAGGHKSVERPVWNRKGEVLHNVLYRGLRNGHC